MLAYGAEEAIDCAATGIPQPGGPNHPRQRRQGAGAHQAAILLFLLVPPMSVMSASLRWLPSRSAQHIQDGAGEGGQEGVRVMSTPRGVSTLRQAAKRRSAVFDHRAIEVPEDGPRVGCMVAGHYAAGDRAAAHSCPDYRTNEPMWRIPSHPCTFLLPKRLPCAMASRNPCERAVARWLLGPISYAAATPGGLFAPLLVVGAVAGAIVAQVASGILPAVALSPTMGAIIGMAAFFTAVVRAPLTGTLLVLGMTGTIMPMLPVLAACLTATIVPTALGSAPIYDTLRERMERQPPTDSPATP